MQIDGGEGGGSPSPSPPGSAPVGSCIRRRGRGSCMRGRGSCMRRSCMGGRGSTLYEG